MAKNYLYNLLLTLANLLFPILSFPYVSRMIGPEGIGKVQFAFSFAQYFAIIANIGVPIYGLKEIARHKNDFQARSQVFSELITIHFLACFSLSVIYLGVIFTFPYFADNRDMHLAAVLLILMGFTYIEWLYSGMEQFRSIALRSVLFKIIGLGLLYLFVRDRSDFRVYLYIMIFSFMGNNVLSLFMTRDKVKPVFSNLQLRKHLKPLFFILGTTLAASMYTDMDTVILGFLSNSKTVGLYTAAVKLSKITLPFVTSMGVILMPKVAKQFADDSMQEIQDTLSKTFNFLVFFAIPVVFGLALLAPEFIMLFSGKEFLPATTSMQILSLLPLIIGFGHMFLYLVLVPAGKNREMFSCVLGGMATSLILNILLVPHFKAIGSSIANICSEAVVTLLYVYFIRKYYRFSYNWWLILKALIAVLIFIPIIYFARQLSMPLIYMVASSVAVCGLMYLLLQLLIFRNPFVFEILNFVKAKFSKVQA
ncbi:flippase [Mucilaginibacter agri]|uniref:Oligosaccharide flippase family protein n=1 Tax=Mucilaginibacter agri TaxID=2695265 RepID=A0A965ZE43_9SPHI|nr:flippase [Mucilaginibacter agri]NCD69379.1 oligosaccharide flippase family protein [Mucilaginibacter agri]